MCFGESVAVLLYRRCLLLRLHLCLCLCLRRCGLLRLLMLVCLHGGAVLLLLHRLCLHVRLLLLLLLQQVLLLGSVDAVEAGRDATGLLIVEGIGGRRRLLLTRVVELRVLLV